MKTRDNLYHHYRLILPLTLKIKNYVAQKGILKSLGLYEKIHKAFYNKCRSEVLFRAPFHAL